MAASTLDGRVSVLEEELADLKKKVDAMESSEPWWERVSGTFSDDPVYRKAMKLGRDYRRLQRPSGSGKDG